LIFVNFLFLEHLLKWSSLVFPEQVGESARKSFSARFFAQANPKLPVRSLAGNKTIGRGDNQALPEDIDVFELISANGAAETSAKDLHLEGSPQLPDLVPTRSPELKQERKGSLPPKQKTGTLIPSSTPANENILPAHSTKLQKEAIDEKAFGCNEQPISTTKHEKDPGMTRDESNSGTAGRGTSSVDSPHSAKHEVLAAPTSDDQQNSRDTVLLPGLDGILNRCALSFVGRTREHEVQSEMNKAGHEENAHASTTGTARRSHVGFSHKLFLVRLCSESNQVCVTVYSGTLNSSSL